MGQLPTTYTRTRRSQCNAGTREETSGPSKPPGQIASKICVLARRKLARPEILTTCIWQRACQLRQTDTHARRDTCEEHQTVDNLNRTATIDASDESSANAPPGIGEGETNAEKGEPGVIAFEVLGITHLGEGESIGVEGFEVTIFHGRRFSDHIGFANGHFGVENDVIRLWEERET